MSKVVENAHTERLERRIGELEDELKAAKEWIDSLKTDVDAQAKLIAEMDDHLDGENAFRDRWIESFEMVLNDKSEWDWNPWLTGRSKIFERYVALQKDWNKFVGEYNSIAPRRRNLGRPLQASDKQREDVLRLRKDGMSLREISDELTLGLSTVRTIIDKKDGVDRATLARLQRIAPDKFEQARERRLKRLRDSLPKSPVELTERNDELRKEAKGLMQR